MCWIGSHLSRYSKVLEPTLGEYRIRPLSPCPRLSWATPKPLNVSAPRYGAGWFFLLQLLHPMHNFEMWWLFCSNIYKQQKLLSISFDANPGHVQQSMVDSQGMWDQMLVVSRRSTPIGATLPFVGFLAFFVVAGFCIYHMNLVRRKPRRRRTGKGGAPRRTFIAKHPVV